MKKSPKARYETLRRQDLQSLEPFVPLIIPEAQSIFLETANPEDLVLLVAAYHEDELIAFGYGEAYPILEQGYIHSLFVKEKYRSHGIGTELLSTLTAAFLSQNISLLQLIFHTYEPSYKAVEKILQKLNWHKPEVIVDRYHFHAPTFQPDWFVAKGPSLPRNLKISSWQHLNKKHFDEIQKKISQNPLLTDVSPFDDPLPIEATNSLVLKKKNEIVGWAVNHRFNPTTIRYSALYVDRDFRSFGPSIALLKESIRRQQASPIPNAIAEINYKRTSPDWLQFVKKRLAPYALSKDSTLNSFFYKKD